MEKHPDTLWQSVKRLVANDSMSIALLTLFLICLIGQGLTGWHAYNGSRQSEHLPTLGLSSYLTTGNFLDGMLSNWQAAILQLTVLIAFGSVLRQRGAAHSRKGQPGSHRTLRWKFTLRPTITEWLYANSMSLVFVIMFVVTFVLHMLFGSWKHNEDQVLRHLPQTSLGAYAGSASFWFSVFECWEAEFAAIGIYIVLSIFLRQENSPESKPVGASNKQTGGANE